MIKVKPINEVLGDSGTVWESLLWKKGYNELKGCDKAGEIRGWFQIDGKYNVVDVYFPALDHLAVSIFPDELKLWEM